MKAKYFQLAILFLPLSLFAQIPLDGLVAYYPFNGNADDMSGNGYNGIVHGATLTSDQFSNQESAYQFDGVDDYIQLPLSIIDGEQGTIACWIQLADTIERNPMFGAGDTTTSQSTFGFYVWSEGTESSQNKLFHVADRRLCGGTQRFFFDTLIYPKVGDWHHVALKSDGLETSMYMDGVQLGDLDYGPYGGATGEWFSDICATNYAFIGRRKREQDDYSFNGIIDEFRIYNRPLTDSEIMALYNDGVCQVTVYDTIYHHVYDTIRFNPNMPTDGLAAYYPFNGNANDESGNGNDGTVIGATYTNDRFGVGNNSLYSASGEEYVEVPDNDSLDLTTSYSISVWVNPDGEYGDGPLYNAIINKWGNLGTASYTLNILTDGVIRFVTNDGNINTQAQGNTPIALNDWTHIVAVQNLDTIKLYHNGKLETMSTGSVTPLIGNSNLYIGTNGGSLGPGGLTRAFNGYIDDIRIYNRALSENEVEVLYTDYQCFVTIYDTLTTEVFDTTFVTVYDTVTVERFDTTYISVTDTLIIDVDFTGIDPPRDNNTIKVYPNPTRDLLYIHTGNYASMDGYSMKIINQLGSVMFETAIENELYEVDLSTWGGAGLYYIQLLDAGGEVTESRKIILE